MTTNAKSRIAILHYAVPPVVGGVESTVAAHARLFADHGYAVKIIAGRGERFDGRVPVQIIPTLDSRHAFVTRVNEKLASGIVPSDFHPLATAMRHALQEAFADVGVCIAHNVLTLHKNLALTFALHEIAHSRRVRLIGWCHDFAWEDPVYADAVHAGMPWDLLRQAWAGVQYVVVSEDRRRELVRLLKVARENIVVVPPGVDVLEFLGATETTVRWARELKLLDAVPLLLLPARVTRRKNVELAIEITAALKHQGHRPKLIVMGPLGAHNPANLRYFDELCALRRARDVEDAVVFLQEHGAVGDAERRDLYCLADALLFTSEREGFGIPILEAGLTRLPIFCSDIPPFRESAGEWAHYFALDEAPPLIAERLARSLAQDEHCQLKRRVIEEYGWARIFEEHIAPLVAEGHPGESA